MNNHIVNVPGLLANELGRLRGVVSMRAIPSNLFDVAIEIQFASAEDKAESIRYLDMNETPYE